MKGGNTMDNLLKGMLVVAGGFIAVYAIRSYGYQKECEGYCRGAMVAYEACEKMNNKNN